ncbi:putative membrane protein [Sphingobium sp. B2D3A]|uniref:DUF1345 domain-containing protein n=1 Tax=unclassified Sphingobium TaxID=2611147 RepID=UPI0022240BB1|nr:MULTISPECIES: DUF1345 domain-containing protein [unclassified Sphingobium]MCW2338934.1 putative membrane protein [Sphingobium sp. B2D3A]MCW2385359.1 putative membrane protein [Sphingobium sp. B2D3D]
MALDLGRRLAPIRFLAFAAILLVSLPLLHQVLGWRHAMMAGFDIAAGIFLLSVWPLLARAGPDQMRQSAVRNDANRTLLLGITGAVSLVVLVAIFSELENRHDPGIEAMALVIATLALAWIFSNMVYALHYAHMFYVRSEGDTDDEGSADARGFDFPGTKEPTYWDFVYFSFTLGMTFQTSDVAVTSTSVRRVATIHCLAAFVFNLGVLAFTINVLGGSGN